MSKLADMNKKLHALDNKDGSPGSLTVMPVLSNFRNIFQKHVLNLDTPAIAVITQNEYSLYLYVYEPSSSGIFRICSS